MARPDPFIPKFPNDIIRSGDWNEIQVRTREELRAHKHTGGSEGSPIPREGIQPNAIDGTRIDPRSKVQLTTLGVSESLKVQGRELVTEITHLINRANELDGRLKAQEAKAVELTKSTTALDGRLKAQEAKTVELTKSTTALDGRLKALDTQKLDRAGGTVTGNLSVQKTLRVASLGIGSAQANLPAKLSLGTDLDNTKLALYDHPTAPYGFGIQSGQFRLHLGNPNARFLFLSAAAGTTLMSIEGRGNVGIGTTDPDAPLHVSTTGELAIRLSTGGNRVVQQFERKGKLLWDMGVGTDANNENFWFGDFQSYRLILHRTSGNVEIPTGDLRIPKGRVISTSKFFRIDHPLDPEHKYLEHCSLEGPEAAVYYRGEARLLDGVATVVLPDYFEALVRPETRTVQLTPKLEGREPVSLLAASSVEGGRFTVKAIDSHNPSQAFYWEVKAVRADIERLQVEVPKPEKAVRPADAGSP